MTKTEQSYFKAAKAISKLSDHRCKIGCVVVKSHRIISSGHNSQIKHHAKQAKVDKEYFNDPKALGPIHAEFNALNYLINQHIDTSGAHLYIYREIHSGDISLSRPCPRCMALIRSCGIKKIHYTGNDSYIKEVLN